MPAQLIRIGCLVDGRTVYIEPAGVVDLQWLRERYPGLRILHNNDVNRDEIQYSDAAYRAFLGWLRGDGWELAGAGASDEEETLTFIRHHRP